MPGRRATIRSRVAYRKESFRQALSMKAVGLFVVFNLVLVVSLGSLVLLGFEREKNPTIDTYGDAVWCTLITIATVGYGDAVPVTKGGKATMVLEILLGVSLLTAFFTLRSANKQKEAHRRAKSMDTRVRVRGHYLVCGWNERAVYVIDRLKSELEPLKTPIVVVCDSETSPCDDDYVFFINGSAVSERDLERANVREAEAAVLLADETRGGDSSDQDARTVLAALTIRSMNPKIRMTAEILVPENTHHLQLAGVGEIYDSNVVTGNFLAQSALKYGTIGMVSEIATRKPSEKVTRIKAEERMVGMTLAQVREHVERELGARLLAVGREERLLMPSDDFRVREGDVLALISDRELPGSS